jgi:hypothetical protein
MMMEYNDRLNNAPFGRDNFGLVDPCQLEGKLDSPSTDAAVARLQPAFMQQHFNGGFFNNTNSNCNSNSNNMNQGLHLAKMQPLNFQPMDTLSNSAIGMANIGTSNQCASDNNIMMNMHNNRIMSTNVQQPFFDGATNFAPFASSSASNTIQRSQQFLNGIPTFATTYSNPALMVSNQREDPLPPSPPLSAPSIVNLDAILDDDSEPTPFCPTWEAKKTAERRKNHVSGSQGLGQSSSCRSLPSLNKAKRLLPTEWVPTSTSVICGNKRKYFESEGNTRFRNVCSNFTHDYATAPNKVEKSAVVSQVMNILRQDCSDGICFVSPHGDRWYAVSERTAREKVGTYLRDCLSGHYLSSAKNKIARRKMTKKELAAVATSSSGSNQYLMATTAAAAPSSQNNSKEDDPDDGSLESIRFYDVDDLTPIVL